MKINLLEISPNQVLEILRKSWRIVLICGFVGLLVSGVKPALQPKIYDGIILIKFPQNLEKNGVTGSVTDAASLLFQMKMPSSYSNDQFEACNIVRKLQTPNGLDALIGWEFIGDSVLKVTYSGDSRENIRACLESLYKLQNKIYNDNLMRYIEILRIDLDEAKEKLASFPKACNDVACVNEKLLLLSDQRRLASQLNRLKVSHPTFLSPIYISNEPRPANFIGKLFLGFWLGIFCGIILSIFQNLFLLRSTAR
jgi:hypothetical protein